MNDAAPEHPIPVPTPTAQPFWDGTKEGKIMIQWCRVCDTTIWYPREFCPHCLESDESPQWIEASGMGRIHTFTVIRQAAHPYFNQHTPYLFGVVELAEGVRMYTNFLMPVEEAECGIPVEPVFKQLNDDITVVQWQPVGAS